MYLGGFFCQGVIGCRRLGAGGGGRLGGRHLNIIIGTITILECLGGGMGSRGVSG